MDIRKVKKLIEMLEESQLNEIEIKEGEESVKASQSNFCSCSRTNCNIQCCCPCSTASSCE